MTSRTAEPEGTICEDRDVMFWVKLLRIVLRAHPDPAVITPEYLREAASLSRFGELIPTNHYYGLDIERSEYPLVIRWCVDTFTGAEVAVFVGATTDVMPMVAIKGEVRLANVGQLIEELKDRVRPYA